MKPAALIATLFLVLVACLHALRVLFRLDLTVGSFAVPLWASVPAVIGLGGLATWLWREQRD